MPDDLYRTDIVTWSRLQADRLRRHLAGERVNDLDWEHVIEEIEELGNSEISAVTSLLTQAMVHALKLARWPTSAAALHWAGEAVNFLAQAQRRYRRSMAGRISVEECFADARRTTLATPGSDPDMPLPGRCDMDLDALMDRAADLRALIDAIGCGPA